ncbi:hypothetical protein [Larkinella terrae]|uniref:Uncharacterized protein n=1 Tax=Larkinella terrae TaxID=2025311 RepID=A0A7K0ELH7_9BACT|nr:hypothetical protein [Larkinella terrae]MRS62562.1 hypothetical protein [Larkinella terrae]
MKFYRTILQLICLLLMGWMAGFLAGLPDAPWPELAVKGVTVEASSVREMTDHLTDGLPRLLVHEAIVAPTVSHPIPLLFFCIIPTVWVLVNCARLTRLQRIACYFFAYFRRLFGHSIAINAP